MKNFLKLSTLILLTILFSQCAEENNETILEDTVSTTVIDVDGNVYETVTIGNQTWMLENLKTTTFNDGTPITEYANGDHWNKENRTFPFFQWASTSDLNNAVDKELPEDYYGAMYNHAAIESGKLAPEGWRIPTEQDWVQLRNFLASNGHQGSEGLALKSSSGWVDSVGNGLNAFEFNGLPNGYVDSFGTPKVDGIICTWATSDFNPTTFRRRKFRFFDLRNKVSKLFSVERILNLVT